MSVITSEGVLVSPAMHTLSLASATDEANVQADDQLETLMEDYIHATRLQQSLKKRVNALMRQKETEAARKEDEARKALLEAHEETQRLMRENQLLKEKMKQLEIADDDEAATLGIQPPLPMPPPPSPSCRNKSSAQSPQVHFPIPRPAPRSPGPVFPVIPSSPVFVLDKPYSDYKVKEEPLPTPCENSVNFPVANSDFTPAVDWTSSHCTRCGTALPIDGYCICQPFAVSNLVVHTSFTEI